MWFSCVIAAGSATPPPPWIFMNFWRTCSSSGLSSANCQTVMLFSTLMTVPLVPVISNRRNWPGKDAVVP